MPMTIDARGLTVDYKLKSSVVHALRGVDFSLKAGEIVCLFGASGSGKSTLLSVLAGLTTPDSGSLRICGKDVGAMSEAGRTTMRLTSVGMVFQDNNLIAQFTALENVELILRCQGTSSTRKVAHELLDALGVGDLADRMPGDMSGGQRQRVGIARALAGDRAVLLCDEPTGALDRSNSALLFDLLHVLARSKNVAIVIATHDRLAEKNADRVMEIVDGEVVVK